MNSRRLILLKKRQKKELYSFLFIFFVYLIFTIGFISALGVAFGSLISLLIWEKCFRKKRSSLFGFER